MAGDKDQLIGEERMEDMSVAPPDPKTGALSSHDGGDQQQGESLMERLCDDPAGQDMQHDTALEDTSGASAPRSRRDEAEEAGAHPS